MDGITLIDDKALNNPKLKIFVTLFGIISLIIGVIVLYSYWETSQLTEEDITLRKLEIEKAKRDLA